MLHELRHFMISIYVFIYQYVYIYRYVCIIVSLIATFLKMSACSRNIAIHPNSLSSI